MRMAQLPVEMMDRLLNTLAECPYKLVAQVLGAVTPHIKIVEVEPPTSIPQTGADNGQQP